jgi:hypothetical protein
VIAAVSTVRMVQMAIHKVIYMVAMRYGFMAAVHAVGVGLAAFFTRHTTVRWFRKTKPTVGRVKQSRPCRGS